MRELDAILKHFLAATYDTLDDEDKARFSALLELPDPDLQAYLVGRNAPADEPLERLLERIRSDFHA